MDKVNAGAKSRRYWTWGSKQNRPASGGGGGGSCTRPRKRAINIEFLWRSGGFRNTRRSEALLLNLLRARMMVLFWMLMVLPCIAPIFLKLHFVQCQRATMVEVQEQPNEAQGFPAQAAAARTSSRRHARVTAALGEISAKK
jgi:type II secretory pathway component PulM